MIKCMNIEKLNAEKGNRRPDGDGKPLQAEGLRDNNPWATPWVKGNTLSLLQAEGLKESWQMANQSVGNGLCSA